MWYMTTTVYHLFPKRNAPRVPFTIYKSRRLFGLILLLFIIFPFHHLQTAPNFPKTANYFLHWSLSNDTARELSKWDLVILDMETQVNSRPQLELIRRLNPDIKMLAYITSQEIRRDANLGSSVLRKRLYDQIDNSWYAADTSGARLSFWPGTDLLNMSTDAPTINGKKMNKVMAEFVVGDILSTGLWDGVFYDNSFDGITFFTGPNVDLDLNGQRDVDPNAAWRTGMKFLYNETRRMSGDRYLIVGNGTSRTYRNELNGSMIENFSPGSWTPTMRTFAFNSDGSRQPKINIINANTNNQGSEIDYRQMRFGLTSALLEDGYYSFDYGDQNHGQLWQYDEYNIDLGIGNGDSEPLNGGSDYSLDVWQRDFEKGISLVNSSDERQLVELSGEFEKIHGVQDSAINDGSIVSETYLDAADGLILLKTFESLEEVVFANGDFVRFFRPDGSRVRNGFFIFEEKEKGGTQIARYDMNGNGKPELIVATHNRLTIYRDDGQLYMRAWPYTGNYRGGLRIAVGDITGTGHSEVIVAPEPGYPAPIKIYTRHGIRLGHDWYPFGSGYAKGYHIATADIFGSGREDIVIGPRAGSEPRVRLYRFAGGATYNLLHSWLAFEAPFRGGVSVAGGDLDGDLIDEIIVGAGPGKPPIVRVFDSRGESLYPEFQAFQSFSNPGIEVGSLDVDFDGVDDIVSLSDGVGF